MPLLNAFESLETVPVHFDNAGLHGEYRAAVSHSFRFAGRGFLIA
ncbi:hypothetical protein JCM19239_1496 [Vibrio variabilis]|uniref:Uncharacterized protein n=1 Tax=Vibrio variabilis TaxID=990271 RepID=A0ABQ0JG83_9VIBR|nr:hypothetical protein JCM19239_1496 [Vibrio variabilis]